MSLCKLRQNSCPVQYLLVDIIHSCNLILYIICLHLFQVWKKVCSHFWLALKLIHFFTGLFLHTTKKYICIKRTDLWEYYCPVQEENKLIWTIPHKYQFSPTFRLSLDSLLQGYSKQVKMIHKLDTLQILNVLYFQFCLT